MTTRAEIVGFLQGRNPLGGRWFGDRIPGVPTYWWRNYLPTLIAPISMVLHCPKCHAQHIDAPDEANGWNNPPHRSHLCGSCGCIWRPADVPTVGVACVATKGEADNWEPPLTCGFGRDAGYVETTATRRRGVHIETAATRRERTFDPAMLGDAAHEAPRLLPKSLGDVPTGKHTAGSAQARAEGTAGAPVAGSGGGAVLTITQSNNGGVTSTPDELGDGSDYGITPITDDEFPTGPC